MSKSIAIVYWTGTGNTEEMARALEAGVSAAGAEARVVPVADFSAEDVSNYDALAFGCPAMGAEELESDEFEPVWEACRDALGDKPVALFGSYGWGTGEWMETWRADGLVPEDLGCADMRSLCEQLPEFIKLTVFKKGYVYATVIANEAPDDDAVAELEAAARSLVEA